MVRKKTRMFAPAILLLLYRPITNYNRNALKKPQTKCINYFKVWYLDIFPPSKACRPNITFLQPGD